MKLRYRVMEAGLTIRDLCDAFEREGIPATSQPTVNKLMKDPSKITIAQAVVMSSEMGVDVVDFVKMVLEECDLT